MFDKSYVFNLYSILYEDTFCFENLTLTRINKMSVYMTNFLLQQGTLNVIFTCWVLGRSC